MCMFGKVYSSWVAYKVVGWKEIIELQSCCTDNDTICKKIYINNSTILNKEPRQDRLQTKMCLDLFYFLSEWMSRQIIY
jgi:hypothetical protein